MPHHIIFDCDCVITFTYMQPLQDHIMYVIEVTLLETK